MTDHYAVNDEHALSIGRSIVANLNWTASSKEVSMLFVLLH